MAKLQVCKLYLKEAVNKKTKQNKNLVYPQQKKRKPIPLYTIHLHFNG